MTKPSYEELRKRYEAIRPIGMTIKTEYEPPPTVFTYTISYCACGLTKAVDAEKCDRCLILELLSETERVRGLLQRIGRAARRDRSGDRIEQILDILAGAESADIGKLDTADNEARLKELLRRGYHLFNVEGTDYAEPEDIGEKWMLEVEEALFLSIPDEKAGSAETGGEKAAPLKRYCGDKHLAMQPNGHCLNCGVTERKRGERRPGNG